MIIAVWIVMALLVGLWSLMAWGLSSLLATDGAWLAQVEPWLARVPIGGWLESWFPQWLQVAQALLSGLQGALSWVGGAAPTLVWLLWGVGTFGLVLAGGVLTLLIALMRRTLPQPPTPPVPPVQAA